MRWDEYFRKRSNADSVVDEKMDFEITESGFDHV